MDKSMGLLSVSAVQVMSEKIGENWDEEVGLWFAGDGKPRACEAGVHVIRAQATLLVKAGIEGQLREVPAERVLGNLRKAQEKKGDLRGGFWWAWEDRKITDHNSGFFTTIQLLMVHHEYRNQLSEKACADLDAMLTEARFWFEHKIYPIRDDKLRYPNAYFGDASCLWLLSEREGKITESLTKDMSAILAYYRDKDWGWGEHLSDLYVKIFQRELMALLIWAKQITPAMRVQVEGLADELAAIDSAFAGGPRVPTIRCYWMDKSPRTPEKWDVWFKPYATLMQPDLIGEFNEAVFAFRYGLHERFPIAPRKGQEVTVDCFGGSRALAVVEDRWRIGVMTKYPLFPDTNINRGHGLHWQSMPVAFWHVNGDWAYLQWLSEEDNVVHGLPSLSRAQNEKSGCRLSDKDAGAYVGLTHGTRVGNVFLVHRRLPKVASSWPWVADRFRIVHPTGSAGREETVNRWHRLAVDYGEETLTVACHPFEECAVARLEEKDGERNFAVRYDFGNGERPDQLNFLWMLTVDRAPVDPPVLSGHRKEGWRIAMADGTVQTLHAETGWLNLK